MPESVIANLIIANDGPKSYRSRDDRVCWSLNLIVKGSRYPLMQVETSNHQHCIEDAIQQITDRLKMALIVNAWP